MILLSLGKTMDTPDYNQLKERVFISYRECRDLEMALDLNCSTDVEREQLRSDPVLKARIKIVDFEWKCARIRKALT